MSLVLGSGRRSRSVRGNRAAPKMWSAAGHGAPVWADARPIRRRFLTYRQKWGCHRRANIPVCPAPAARTPPACPRSCSAGRPQITPLRYASGCSPCRARTRAARGSRSARAASGLSAGDVDRALTEDRTLLITWLNRGTLHLVRSEDYPWLQALTAPPLLHRQRPPPRPGGRDARRRRSRRRGHRARARRRGAADPRRSCASGSPPRACAPRARRSCTCFMLACLRGLTVRGPMVGREHAYVLVRDWLGEPPDGRPRRRAGRARAPLPRRARPGGRPRPGALGGPAAARRARRARRRSPPSCTSARTGSSTSRGASPPRRLPAAAAARPVRPGAAGLDLARAAARRPSGHRHRSTGSSARSRSCAAARPRPGGWPPARSTIEPFEPLAPRRRRRRWTPRRPTSCGSWPPGPERRRAGREGAAGAHSTWRRASRPAS